jgi:hypothetical protein
MAAEEVPPPQVHTFYKESGVSKGDEKQYVSYWHEDAIRLMIRTHDSSLTSSVRWQRVQGTFVEPISASHLSSNHWEESQLSLDNSTIVDVTKELSMLQVHTFYKEGQRWLNYQRRNEKEY